ncbi:hypothetical protein BD289DRAFT_186127 [Coniella lustricola]|uniref:Uncharacterized protein n=1 Tax=Coniella lustricola TaxID=2025994 RepID=A0A2T3AD24_9PEZI|nr:hypothetical protein BD289DRAFT_186127 [Coniella lustricola]
MALLWSVSVLCWVDFPGIETELSSRTSGGAAGVETGRASTGNNFVEGSIYSMMLRDYETQRSSQATRPGPRSGRLQLSEHRKHLDK